MAKTLFNEIRGFIEGKLDEGYKKFIIFPFGDIGFKVKEVLSSVYGIRENYVLVLDNHLWKYNRTIKPLDYVTEIKREDYAVLFASTNINIYEELKRNLLYYFELAQIAELPSMKVTSLYFHTKIGKYSYGPICCDHEFIESIGAFCSFAMGVDAVGNHEKRFVTTSPMIRIGQNFEGVEIDYQKYKGEPWYFEGVQSHKEVMKIKRSKIGNDVWLGRNVLITNGANIGNGVIAGAGAVITKDIPDYAIVGGVPARPIKYRYLPEQIEMLNKIKWWDWSDEEIRDRFDDFYLPIDEFIKKYT